MRLAQAALRRELRAGKLELAAALDDERAARIVIFDLLACRRGWGPRRVSRLLEQLRISEVRRCEALTPRQRAAIVAAVRR